MAHRAPWSRNVRRPSRPRRLGLRDPIRVAGPSSVVASGAISGAATSHSEPMPSSARISSQCDVLRTLTGNRRATRGNGRSELAGLGLDDVSPASREATVTGKGDKQRTVRFTYDTAWRP